MLLQSPAQFPGSSFRVMVESVALLVQVGLVHKRRDAIQARTSLESNSGIGCKSDLNQKSA